MYIFSITHYNYYILGLFHFNNFLHWKFQVEQKGTGPSG